MGKAKAVKKVGKKLKALTEKQKVNQKPGIEKYMDSKGKKMPAGKVKAMIKNIEKDQKKMSGNSPLDETGYGPMARLDDIIIDIKKANPKVAKSIDAKDTKSFNKFQSRIKKDEKKIATKSKPKKKADGGMMKYKDGGSVSSNKSSSRRGCGAAKRGFGRALR